MVFMQVMVVLLTMHGKAGAVVFATQGIAAASAYTVPCTDPAQYIFEPAGFRTPLSTRLLGASVAARAPTPDRCTTTSVASALIPFGLGGGHATSLPLAIR